MLLQPDARVSQFGRANGPFVAQSGRRPRRIAITSPVGGYASATAARQNTHMLRIGIISDTHGLLRPEAREFLRGSDHIVHGGDIGDAAILEALSELAPVTAVRGNNDRGPWADRIAETESLDIGGIRLYVIHDVAQLSIDPRAEGVRVVIAGHSHKPAVVERDGVLYVNPGSAGRRRFRLPIAAGELRIDGAHVAARTVELLPGDAP